MSLFKTKTFWSGVASITTGIGLIACGNLPEGVQMIGAGIVAICLRDAVKKTEKRI